MKKKEKVLLSTHLLSLSLQLDVYLIFLVHLYIGDTIKRKGKRQERRYTRLLLLVAACISRSEKFFPLVLTRLIDTLHVKSEIDVRANRVLVMFIFHRICCFYATDVLVP
jgi:hypothetical protein